MKFFIFGDSWGVGEWRRDRAGAFELVLNTGIDHWLTQLGHQVTNISAGSAGNFGQLRHAYWTLHEHSDYDYMIWFYTENLRDLQEIGINDPAECKQQYPDLDVTDIDQALRYVQQQNFGYAQALYNRYQIPFVVVGGQSTVPDEIHNYSFAPWVIKSWMRELLELDYWPPEMTFFSWPKLERIIDHYGIDKKQYILEHIDSLNRSQQITQLAQRSDRFPDNSHPSAECHQELTKRILQMITPC